MSQSINILFTNTIKLQWWQAGKLLGALALCVVAILLVTGVSVHPLVIGLVVHAALDFALQSDWVAMNKLNGSRALVVHSVIAGGLPSAIVGLCISPIAVLVGIVVGISTHYLIDRTNKFGLPVAQGATLDQVLHIVAVLLLV